MSETVEAETGPEAGAPPDGAASAVALALAQRTRGPGAESVDAEAAAYLRDQRRLTNLQTEHLHEQRELITSRLKLGRWKDRVTLTLQGLTALVGLAVAAAIAVMAWQAHEDHGVSIQAFSVPPDLAQRGMTGQVVASKLLDRLSELQARTVTGRPASSYASDWGDDIKVEIPETGVSIGELNRWLRQWLGSGSRIGGEVVRTPAGLAVTARVGAASGQTFEGPEADLPRLIQQAAESVYARTQPYRWAVWLASTGRQAEAERAYAWLAEHGDREDRAWANLAWATDLLFRYDPRPAADKARTALELDPRIDTAYRVLNNALDVLGEHEQELANFRTQVRLLQSGRIEGVTDIQFEFQAVDGVLIPSAVGDYGSAVATLRRLGRVQGFDAEGAAGAFSVRSSIIRTLLGYHDVSGALALGGGDIRSGGGRFRSAWEKHDWAALLALRGSPLESMPVVRAYVAVALARLGRLAEARAEISPTASDCDDCLEARGLISALSGDRTGADRWFATAARLSPSLPQPDEAWGRALLELGDADAAVSRAREASRRGPRWADPLELWGEALLKKGDYAGAAARFAQADQRAPRWGRNHLMWGEALMLGGRYAQARRQYEIAAGLDLSRPDRAALDVLLARTARGPLHG
jgi:tetratricopeptide (TPR) repeat protein